MLSFEHEIDYLQQRLAELSTKIRQQQSSIEVQELLPLLEKQRASAYAIVKHPLFQQDEHIQELYLTMLFVIFQNSLNKCKEAQFFLERIVAGHPEKKSFIMYMQKSLKMDESFITEFVAQFKDHHLRENFVLDCLLLLASDGMKSTQAKVFVTVLFEILQLTVGEVQAFSKIAKAIVTQQPLDAIGSEFNIPKLEKIKIYYSFKITNDYQEVKVPKLAESITEGTVAWWGKKVGEWIDKGEFIVELETDKVNAEIIAEQAGVLVQVLAEEGEVVKVGQVIALLRV